MPSLPKQNPARRNKSTTKATLALVHNVTAPELPEHAWHDLTLEWWRDIWASPMAPEYDDSDRHGLFVLAHLVDDFWQAESPTMRKELAVEIRQQGQRFGLSPIDRRRLQWEIERTEEAQEKGDRRRQSQQRSVESAGRDDPRAALG